MVRSDRIGDLVLTLPLIEVLARSELGGTRRVVVEALLAPGPAPLAPSIPHLGECLVDPGDLLGLAGRLRDRAYDLAILPYASARLAAATWLAGIPRRIGNGLRLYSPLFTDRVRLHRSRPPIHEADYCLGLLGPLGLSPERPPLPRLVPPTETSERARGLLSEAGLGDRELVVVHPGGGGSAGRPSPEDFARFARIARDAAHPGATLCVSHGPGEEALAEETRSACEGLLLPPAPDVAVYQAMLARSALFLAGSTGPLHLAAASGVPTLGFYPWKASQTATRWAPRGERTATLSPPREGCRDCEEGRCTAPACFARISPEEVARQARRVVS